MKDGEKDEIRSLIKEYVTSKPPAKPPAKKKKGGGDSGRSDSVPKGEMRVYTCSCQIKIIIIATPSKLVTPTKVTTPTKATTPSKVATPSKTAAASASDEPDSSTLPAAASGPDNSFYEFCQLCRRLEKEPSYNAKTKLISHYIKFGTSGSELVGVFVGSAEHNR